MNLSYLLSSVCSHSHLSSPNHLFHPYLFYPHLLSQLILCIIVGNLVYVGSKASFIRSLMIGKVSEITGAEHEPRYESMFLQGMSVTVHDDDE